MKKQWRIADIIDLEYFLALDRDAGEGGLKQRDRRIYREVVQPRMQAAPHTLTGSHRPAMIREWLEARRTREKTTPDTLLPGRAFEDAYALFVFLFAVMGLSIGAGAAFSFLTYTGKEPLNVSVFLGLIVAAQVLMLAFMLIVFLLKRFYRPFVHLTGLYALLGAFLVRIILKIKERFLNKIPARNKVEVFSAIGLLKGKKQIYGSLFYWPLFILGQIFGIFFNTGVLAAMLTRVVSADIAFGWQSTVQLSPRMVYEIVKNIAAPWAWFTAPPTAYPTLAQIEGSRMILKEGIYHLSTQNLVSWWPFLCFAVLFYGLLPRLVLLVTGIIARQSALNSLDFEFTVFDRMIRRMETPLIRTDGTREDDDRPDELKIAKPVRPRDAAHIGKNGIVPDNNLVALIPEDIFGQCNADALTAAVQARMGYGVFLTLPVSMDMSEIKDQEVMEIVTTLQWEGGRINALLIQEAWQPPILETLLFIRELRNRLGETAAICICLIGTPSQDSIITSVAPKHSAMWNQKLASLSDPRLEVERLVDDGTV